MDVWEKLNSLTDYLGEDALLEELIGYLTTSQLEGAVEYIARKTNCFFDYNDNESEN